MLVFDMCRITFGLQLSDFVALNFQGEKKRADVSPAVTIWPGK